MPLVQRRPCGSPSLTEMTTEMKRQGGNTDMANGQPARDGQQQHARRLQIED